MLPFYGIMKRLVRVHKPAVCVTTSCDCLTLWNDSILRETDAESGAAVPHCLSFRVLHWTANMLMFASMSQGFVSEYCFSKHQKCPEVCGFHGTLPRFAQTRLKRCKAADGPLHAVECCPAIQRILGMALDDELFHPGPHEFNQPPAHHSVALP